MIDELTDEAARTAFADLRARELPRTTAPGVAAAYRTVRRRRRRTATGLAAGVTALLLLGGGYLAGEGGPGPAPIPPAGFGVPSQPVDRTPGWMDLDPDEVPLSGLASAAVGRTDGRLIRVTVFDFTIDQMFFDDEPVVTLPPSLEPPSAATPYLVMGASAVRMPQLASAAGPESGDYRLRVACAGPPAVLDVTVQVGDRAGTVTVECGPTAEAARIGYAETELGEFTEEEFAAGVAVSVWRGELPGPPQPRAMAFALVPEHYERPED